MLIDIYTKFHEDSLMGFQVLGQRDFVMDKVPRKILKTYKCKSYGFCALHVV